MAKRLFDVFASSLGLILCAPLLLIIATWIKLDSPGPVFYRGKRAGRALWASSPEHWQDEGTPSAVHHEKETRGTF